MWKFTTDNIQSGRGGAFQEVIQNRKCIQSEQKVKGVLKQYFTSELWLNVMTERASYGRNSFGKFCKNPYSIYEVKPTNSKFVVGKWDPIFLIGSGWEAQT